MSEELERRQRQPVGESRDRSAIYRAIARAGAPLGRPFTLGIASLTERVVRYFRQRGFFGFETFERPREKNRFTLYGAARFFGKLNVDAAQRAMKKKRQQ
jgi:hypothetical protein